LNISSVIDSNPAFSGTFYREIPILDQAASNALSPDGIVISNVNPAQIDRIESDLKKDFSGPILRLWHPVSLSIHQLGMELPQQVAESIAKAA
jgi:hypothetical protein